MYILCNGVPAVRELSPALPILGIDYYPLSPTPTSDRGAWAIGDIVRYAQRNGAERIWVLPQMFESVSWRGPSVEEFRIQIYSSLAEGATGFVPFMYCSSNGWYDKNIYGGKREYLGAGLIDTFGNPTPCWDEMERLGPYLRSVGPLLVASKRLADTAVTAQVRDIIATNGGRKRPACIARMFKDKSRDARYIVVYNNTLLYPESFNVVIAELGKGEKILDLFSLREIPLKDNTFPEHLRPGDGRVYAVADANEISVIKKIVAGERFDLEHDLLKIEFRLAKKMGTDVVPAEKVDTDGQRLMAGGDFGAALAKMAEAKETLEKQNRANATYWRANAAIEASRFAMGRINQTMSRRMAGIENGFMGSDSDVKKTSDRMIGLADRFYTLQTQLLQQGPDNMSVPAETLLADIQTFERFVNAFFGI